jgi:hypothetical protein
MYLRDDPQAHVIPAMMQPGASNLRRNRRGTRSRFLTVTVTADRVGCALVVYPKLSRSLPPSHPAMAPFCQKRSRTHNHGGCGRLC